MVVYGASYTHGFIPVATRMAKKKYRVKTSAPSFISSFFSSSVYVREFTARYSSQIATRYQEVQLGHTSELSPMPSSRSRHIHWNKYFEHLDSAIM